MKCEKSKANRHKRQTKLIQIPTGEHLFEEIAMDFITELPKSEAFNAILVVADRFIKVQHYITAKTTCRAKDVANSNNKDIWKLYNLLRHITLDCGLQFAAKFLKKLNQKLNINLHLSTAYHLQTDGLSKQAVQTLKQYLCIYCHNRQNCW